MTERFSKMVNTIWQFATAGNISFGRGSRTQLVEQLGLRKVRRPLLVTDQNVLATDPVRELLASLKSAADVVLFEDCQAEPSVALAEQACELAKQSHVDGVIGIGGGSNLDVAKIAALVARYGGHPRDYFGFDAVPGPVLPLFALPTTAGTGSEVSHSAVLTDTSRQIKVSTLSRWLRPNHAIVDPALTDSCPRQVTAHSGIDALVHAIEAYTNRNFSEMVGVDPQARAYEGSYPLTQLLAAEAIRLVGRSLIPACEQPDLQVARDEMALAALLAGMAFSNSGVGIVHALEYPVGALTHCGHGEGNGLLLPHVMRYNLPVRMTEFGEIARWLGADVVGLSQRQTAEQAIHAVERLLDSINIKRQLSQLGLERAAVPEVAQKAFEIKRLMDINPQTPTLGDLEAILLAAY
jgi:alcohol dehydrogenase class IV